jgi:hypothetical protein
MGSVAVLTRPDVGHPTTVVGLLEVLRAAAPDVPAIVAQYQELAGKLRPPRRTKRLGRTLPPLSAAALTAAAAATLAAEVARYVATIPELVEALTAVQDGVKRPLPEQVAPVYVPDTHAGAVIDAGTMQEVGPLNGFSPVTAAGVSVPWWPTPAPEADLPLQNCPPALVIWFNHAESSLLAWAQTVQLLDQTRANWTAASAALAAGKYPRSRRDQFTRAASAYRRWHAMMAGQSERFITAWVSQLNNALHNLAALLELEGNSTMPVLSSSPTIIATVAAQIRDRITEGQSGRINSGQSEQAFGWSVGLARTLVDYVTTTLATSRHIDVVQAADSGAPIGPVAERGNKPDAVVFTSTSFDLAKFAGIATLSTEAANWVSNIETSVSGLLISRILRGVEADLVTAIDAGAGVTAGGATLTAGVLDAIAQVSTNGGQAGVLACSAGDWVELMSASGTSGFLSFSTPEQGPSTYLGLVPVIVPGIVDGTAYVYDPRAVTVYEAAGGPLMVVDLGSKIRTNEIQIAGETWAGSWVTAPGNVAKVTVTVTP